MSLTTAGPATTVTIGASGVAQITLSSSVTHPSGIQCFVGVSSTGSCPGDATSYLSLNYFTNANSETQSSLVQIITGLTPGSITFTACYRAAGGTCTYSSRQIVVGPL